MRGCWDNDPGAARSRSETIEMDEPPSRSAPAAHRLAMVTQDDDFDPLVDVGLLEVVRV